MANMALMYQKFVKYDDLKRLIGLYPSTRTLQLQPVDIYIDIQSVYRRVLSEELMSNDNKIISINVLNLAAHYRHFFRYIGVDSRIYLVNGTPYTDNIYSIENANHKRDMFEIVSKLAPYFPCVYYIDKPFLGSAMIYNLIQTNTHMMNHSAFVISNDIYSYQLPANLQNTFLLRPSHSTKLITYNNVLLSMFPRNKSVDLTQLSPGLIPVILGYHKCPELGLEMINTLKNTVSIIQTNISKGKMLNGYNSLNIFNLFETPNITERIAICDLPHFASIFECSFDNLDVSWKISKQCDVQTLSSIIDSKINTDPYHLLNYMFLLDISIEFANRFK